MADEEQAAPGREPLIDRLRRKPYLEIGGYQLWGPAPGTNVQTRWTFGPHKAYWGKRHTNADIVKPFPEEENYFVSLNEQVGWIRGGFLDAIALALTFLEKEKERSE